MNSSPRTWPPCRHVAGMSTAANVCIHRLYGGTPPIETEYTVYTSFENLVVMFVSFFGLHETEEGGKGDAGGIGWLHPLYPLHPPPPLSFSPHMIFIFPAS